MKIKKKRSKEDKSFIREFRCVKRNTRLYGCRYHYREYTV